MKSLIQQVRCHQQLTKRGIYSPGQASAVKSLGWALYRQRFKFTGNARLGSTALHFPRLDLANFLFWEIFVGHEYGVQLGRNPLILDCGANIGFATRYFDLRFPESTIIAFEPNPSAVPFLEKNTKGLSSDISVHPVAVGRRAGELTLVTRDGDGSVLASTHPPSEDPGAMTLTVPVERLSGYINADVDLLKLDVEGGETDVLEELIESGRLNRIKSMWIEYHLHCATRADFGYFMSLLDQSGFVYQIRADFNSSSMAPPYKRQAQGIGILAYRPTE